ncbi:MAG: trypsin-like peptidase domain-containing protein, partial [Rikenellaceae bacterium]|nr:trypsin-like peptidase domain-containing protein [Rikenellaceae bacterium]
MKKGAILGMIAASALAGGVVSYGVSKAVQGGDEASYSSAFVESNDRVPTHFTTYDVAGYPDLTYAAENAVKAVVSIDNKREVRRRSSQSREYNNPFFEYFGIPIPEGYGQPESRENRSERSEQGELRVQGSGSGVLISEDGYIVTNNHVVDGAAELGITLNDGRTFTARLVGTDPTTDVALVKIDTDEPLPFLPFGDSGALRLGEWVLAIGTPYSLESTVTAGIVSAKGRNLRVIEDRMSLEAFIQTDAAVNPGNSGGALVNTKGELIGINTLIQSPTGSYTGYSFAVPSSIVKKVASDLRDYGVAQRAILGIEYEPVNAETGIAQRGGISVADLTPGGAAEAAGIQKGDVLFEINGVEIVDGATLSEQIARYR